MSRSDRDSLDFRWLRYSQGVPGSTQGEGWVWAGGSPRTPRSWVTDGSRPGHGRLLRYRDPQDRGLPWRGPGSSRDEGRFQWYDSDEGSAEEKEESHGLLGVLDGLGDLWAPTTHFPTHRLSSPGSRLRTGGLRDPSGSGRDTSTDPRDWPGPHGRRSDRGPVSAVDSVSGGAVPGRTGL